MQQQTVMRKVIFQPKKSLAFSGKGYFHGFGTQAADDYRGGVIQETIAIIEDLDGNIHCLRPEEFKFEEKSEKQRMDELIAQTGSLLTEKDKDSSF